jgi:hypothetical protein
MVKSEVLLTLNASFPQRTGKIAEAFKNFHIALRWVKLLISRGIALA